ncbi:MAG: SusC/RagA family protein, partial [Leptolyngbya sp. SIO1D8]|nr:SusC/RagA family protein [Leptolyngbya sp. SIO1D8]
MKTKLQKVIFMLSKYFIYGLIIQSFFLNFLLASDGNAQRYKSMKEVFIVLEFERSSIPDLLEAIENSSQFKFSYDIKDIDDKIIVSVPKGRNSVAAILDRVVNTTALGFKQINNDINVRKIDKKVRVAKIEITIDKQISGRVRDESGQPLPGVTVLMKNTNKGTSTDSDGYYKLTVPDEVTTLVFSFIGYLSEEVEIGNLSTIDVVMMPDVQKLSEVVVIGYGTQQARNVTSAISTVKSKDLREVPVPGLDQALQGRAAGVQVT